MITKYGHSKGHIAHFDIYEVGHPIPDANSFRATQSAIDAVTGLTEKDTVLFLLSGGGSALFEKPLIPEQDLRELTNQLLACGGMVSTILPCCETKGIIRNDHLLLDGLLALYKRNR